MKAIIVPVYDNARIQDLNTLVEIKQALDGGWLEAIRLTNNAVGYIDEEGKLKNLSFNLKATGLVRHCHPGWPDVIVGPMVVFGSLNESGEPDGDEHDCPQWVLEYFRIVTDGQHRTKT